MSAQQAHHTTYVRVDDACWQFIVRFPNPYLPPFSNSKPSSFRQPLQRPLAMAAQTNLRVQLDAFNIKDPVASVSLTSAPIPEPAEVRQAAAAECQLPPSASLCSLQLCC